MSAFIIVDTKINNPTVYEEYKKLAKPIAEKYGGVYRARAFIDSDEYKPVKLLRTESADCTLFILDGD